MKISILVYGYNKDYPLCDMQLGSGEIEVNDVSELQVLKKYDLTTFQKYIKFNEHQLPDIIEHNIPLKFWLTSYNEEGFSVFNKYIHSKKNNMAKNNKPDFKSGTKNVFDNIVNPEVPTVENAPQATTEEPKKNPVGRPRSVGYTRTSVILNDEQMSKVRCISGRDNVNQKDIIEYALQMFIDKYESVHGTVEVEVTSGKRDVNSLFDL